MFKNIHYDNQVFIAKIRYDMCQFAAVLCGNNMGRQFANRAAMDFGRIDVAVFAAALCIAKKMGAFVVLRLGGNHGFFCVVAGGI